MRAVSFNKEYFLSTASCPAESLQIFVDLKMIHTCKIHDAEATMLTLQFERYFNVLKNANQQVLTTVNTFLLTVHVYLA